MWFLLGFLALVLVEIVLLIQLGGAIGIWLTLGWIVLTGGLGIILLKGIALYGVSSLGFRADAFNDPRSPMAHRGLVLIAGILLLLPGPLTDSIGILFLFAPVRSVIIRLVARRFENMRSASVASVVVDGEWRDITGRDASNQPDPKDPSA